MAALSGNTREGVVLCMWGATQHGRVGADDFREGWWAGWLIRIWCYCADATHEEEEGEEERGCCCLVSFTHPQLRRGQWQPSAVCNSSQGGHLRMGGERKDDARSLLTCLGILIIV
jgi:hypothetical protein